MKNSVTELSVIGPFAMSAVPGGSDGGSGKAASQTEKPEKPEKPWPAGARFDAPSMMVDASTLAREQTGVPEPDMNGICL